MKTLTLILTLLCFIGCSKPPGDDRKATLYQCSMHPWITSESPGNCTICGMKLVPHYEGDKAAKQNVVSLNDDSVAVLNVATVPVRRLDLIKSLHFSGILEDNDNLHRVIAAFYDGRIDKVYIDHVGQYVEKGQPLAAIYSPDLLYIVKEFQNAIQGRNDAAARSSAQRLVQYGLSPEQVNGLANQSNAIFTIDLLAPISGTVITKNAYQGKYIKTGEPLFEMGDLSRMWFHAEVYERDLPDIRLGQKAILRTPTVPGRDFDGTVTFIDPNFDPQTRSTKVRIEVDNPAADGDARGLRRILPHRAYAEADILASLGSALVVPRTAVLRDGRRSVIYMELANGRYEQRSVKTGRVGDEGIEVLDGLQEGDRVVTQGNLMIDAEAQLRQTEAPAGPSEAPLAASLSGHGEVIAFLQQLAMVSEALAMDDLTAAINAGQNLQALAAALPNGKGEELKAAPLMGSDLKALRQSFLPWSQTGAELAIELLHSGANPGVHVYECPMTGDSFPGAPPRARWVQSGSEVRNPYFGSEMLNCGDEIKP